MPNSKPTETKLQEAAVVLLRECFEGREADKNYTWFVQGKEGLFDALDSCDATRASTQPRPSVPSIGAHCVHILFALRNVNTLQGRPEPEGDWESTWLVSSMFPEVWADLVASIKDEYRLLLAWFASNSDWSNESSTLAALAIVPHMAYHLGAVRQLLRVI